MFDIIRSLEPKDVIESTRKTFPITLTYKMSNVYGRLLREGEIEDGPHKGEKVFIVLIHLDSFEFNKFKDMEHFLLQTDLSEYSHFIFGSLKFPAKRKKNKKRHDLKELVWRRFEINCYNCVMKIGSEIFLYESLTLQCLTKHTNEKNREFQITTN